MVDLGMLEIANAVEFAEEGLLLFFVFVFCFFFLMKSLFPTFPVSSSPSLSLSPSLSSRYGNPCDCYGGNHPH